MRLNEKLDMFLMGEASVKLTPLAKSSIRLQDNWSKQELDDLVANLTKNVKDKMKYEVTLNRKEGTLGIYRRGDDVLRRNMGKEDVAKFKKEIQAIVKGTGLKIVGDAKSADWVSAIVSR